MKTAEITEILVRAREVEKITGSPTTEAIRAIGNLAAYAAVGMAVLQDEKISGTDLTSYGFDKRITSTLTAARDKAVEDADTLDQTKRTAYEELARMVSKEHADETPAETHRRLFMETHTPESPDFGDALAYTYGVDFSTGDDETLTTTFAPLEDIEARGPIGPGPVVYKTDGAKPVRFNAPGGMQDNATLDEYQEASSGSAFYPGKDNPLGLVYLALKLNGEAGEFAEHVGKAMRDERSLDTWFDNAENRTIMVGDPLTTERVELLKKELGDVLWYVAAAARELGFTLNEIAHANLDKLHDRAKRGTQRGSGDNR